jgi:hypothetical protein
MSQRTFPEQENFLCSSHSIGSVDSNSGGDPNLVEGSWQRV